MWILVAMFAITFYGDRAESATYSITGCSDCHGNPPVDSATRGTPTAAVIGDHGIHVTSYGFTCSTCHPTNSQTNHMLGTIQTNASMTYDKPGTSAGNYSKGTSFPTTSAQTTAIMGKCYGTYCHSNGTGGTAQLNDARSIISNTTPSFGAAITNCNSCHGGPSTGPTYAATVKANAHPKHSVSNSFTCNICHNSTTVDGLTINNYGLHVNATYDVSGTVVSNYSYSTNGGSCNANCHEAGVITATNLRWNVTTPANTDRCTKCHGNWTTGTAQEYQEAPGAYASSPSTTLFSGSSIAAMGAHQAHLTTNAYRNPILCKECHIVPTNPTDSGHMSGTAATVSFLNSVLANTYGQAKAGATYTPGSYTCSTVYCHDGRYFKNGWSTGSVINPAWGWSTMLAVSATTADCGKCHGYPPTQGTHVNQNDCGTCHSHVTAGANPTTFTNLSAHIDGKVQGPFDCLACHNSARPKTKGTIGTIRQVVGTGGDFFMNTIGGFVNAKGMRHLYGASTIVLYDCIVCHSEGKSDLSGLDTYHNDASGLIDLRNVDTNALGWSIDNKAWTTNDYTKMDQFCVTCHDANGAAGISVSGTSGLYLPPTATQALTPFNSTDFATGQLLGSTTVANAPRTRVINVKDQFYAGTVDLSVIGNGASYNGNPSQHAVLGRRYSSINVAWGTTWASVIIKKTGQDLAVTKETSLLSCADCHILDAGAGGNAHGGKYAYNMWGTNITTTCWKCHKQSTYANWQTNFGSRTNHRLDGSWSGNEGAYGFSATAGFVNCLNCHASFNESTTVTRQASLGGIHGSWSSTATMTVTGGAAKTTQRFFPGTYFRVGWGSEGGWSNGQGTSVSCYFNTAAQKASTCSSHDGTTAPGTRSGTIQYSRPTKY